MRFYIDISFDPAALDSPAGRQALELEVAAATDALRTKMLDWGEQQLLDHADLPAL